MDHCDVFEHVFSFSVSLEEVKRLACWKKAVGDEVRERMVISEEHLAVIKDFQ